MIDFAGNPERTILAACAAALLSVIAWRVRALTLDGAAASVVVGAGIVGGGGWWTGFLLVVFFLTSTSLSRIARRRTSHIRQAKGDRRDAMQVLANGGVPLVFALLSLVFHAQVWIVGAVVAIAVATADTWATEIGRVSQAVPRSITTFRRVPVGTSGAISWPGTSATLAGAVVIGGMAAMGHGWLSVDLAPAALAAFVCIGGAGGSLLDSLIGAALQERRACPACGSMTEATVHDCGTPSVVTGGIAGLNNDVVNVLACAIPAVLGTGLAMITG